MCSVRTLMDGGDGPPMLRVGDAVVRGVDWGKGSQARGNEDGRDLYDAEKARRDSLEKETTTAKASPVDCKDAMTESPDPVDEDPPGKVDDTHELSTEPAVESNESVAQTLPEEPPKSEAEIADTKKPKKSPSPKLPVGIVVAVESWKGVPAMARRVRWKLTGVEGVYRFGGDGGIYELCHVEVNSRGTRIKKRYPLPESSEQCAARHGFGTRATHSVLLRVKKYGTRQVDDNDVTLVCDGILEWPDFGAGVRVKCTRHEDGSVTLEETELMFGSKDSGWNSRFGQPSFVSGTRTRLSPVKKDVEAGKSAILESLKPLSAYEELAGTSSFVVDLLRNPADGGKLAVSSCMRLYKDCQYDIADISSTLPQSPVPPPISFDREYHAPSLSLSRDGRTVSCVSSEGGRGTAFGAIGFTKGVHYWEIKLEQADIGSVFIGVAEKPIGSGSGSSYNYDSPPRLNRWLGWGFVNFRATYTSGAERIFGSHCHSGDTVGVLLDCDAGRVSFFFDGLKYGEHILNDLGCAFENISPFGFNVDGCGSGGAGQGAPSGFDSGSSNRLPAQGTIQPRTLFPVIGLRNQGDRITLSSKWNTTFGVDGVVSLRNIIAFDELLASYSHEVANEMNFPLWFLEESLSDYSRWIDCRWTRSTTRGSGPFRSTSSCLDVYFDLSPMACAAASAALGLNEALLAGDRVKLSRSAGRILELAEEAIVLGCYQGRLYYRIVSQKSEGGSLNEGGGRAWCWDESEVVDPLLFVLPSKGHGIRLPKLARFACPSNGGLRVVYDNGAVLRSDLEIFDGSVTLGTIPVGTVIQQKDVLDRRVNSCGVVRFRVRYSEIGVGWISARIRGGTEELIVEPVVLPDGSSESVSTDCHLSPMSCASEWYKSWKDSQVSLVESCIDLDEFRVASVDDFQALASQACISGLSSLESDMVFTSAINAISNFSDSGDSLEIQFQHTASALSYAVATVEGSNSRVLPGASAAAHQAVAAVFSRFDALPPVKAILTRISMLRSFNRRARFALPWMPIRPCQEGSAILGGLFGHGTAPDRAGRARLATADESWVQVPSVASELRVVRGILFTSVKRDFLNSIVDATTTPTPLSHDEYELPRDIRTVRINRLKAGRAMLGDDRSAKRKFSVFAQLLNETKNWGGAALRRGYVAKGHGGQKRAFKVKLIGEGVNDYSGPYREAFTDAIAEVTKVDADGRCPLGVLDCTPNNASSLGENRDLFMFALNGHELAAAPRKSDSFLPSNEDHIRKSFASLLVPRDEASREVEESLVFLGRLAGTAFRHGIPLDIPLPMASVWKALTEDPVSAAEKLRELDELAYRQLEDEKDAEASPLLLWQQRMLNAFAEGLGNVLPIEVLPLLTGEELRDAICGNPDVDADLLKRIVEYEGYVATDPVIGYFWDTLNDMTNSERKQFLQFVWARNRLPMRESDFDAPFKILKDPQKSDQALPSASTCFFTLTLPEYSSQEVLRNKLLFAISNVTTMETDFQTNSAEIAEGYRGFEIDTRPRS
jgi:HECT-domain (ubiquitin-transferase)/SPRY domain